MSRILLAWELGSNLGHLSRLLPLGRRLRARGHTVLAVVRDLAAAARALGPADIPFIQAPAAIRMRTDSAQPASYADALLHVGWGDVTQLWGMVQAWVNVIRMFSPKAIVIDHSPTAILAARCAGIPCVLIGTGFELPPLKDPLPVFPGVPGITAEDAAKAEGEVLENTNVILKTVRAQSLPAVSGLFRAGHRWLTTFAELDHYGPRDAERYVGPIGEIEYGERVDWPNEGDVRVLAYLRPDTPGLTAIVQSLAASEAAVLCYGPGISSQQISAVASNRFVISSRPVDFRSLAQDASLCVSYSPAGTVASTLLRGLPQLLAPPHVEAQLTAHRVERIGAGRALRENLSIQQVTSSFQELVSDSRFKTRASEFAARYRGFDPGHAAEIIVDDIESLASQRA